MISTSSPEVTRAVVIYHDNCCDGFGSAWSFYRLAASCYKDGVTYKAFSYGQLPDLTDYSTDSDVYILDFSFGRGTLVLMADHFASVTVLDHHKTAEEALSNWSDKPSNLEIIFDQSRSGARISWEYFADTPGTPQLIRYIEDRDLWRHEMTNTKELNALIGFSKKEFSAYDALHNGFAMSYGNMVAQGALLLESHQRHCSSIISATKREIVINGKKGLICNCPGQFASDVGNVLANESGTYGATYFAAADGSHKFSLRSNGDYDVSRMAKDFGGGGHKNAAGFSITAPIDTGAGMNIWIIKTGDDLPDDYEV